MGNKTMNSFITLRQQFLRNGVLQNEQRSVTATHYVRSGADNPRWREQTKQGINATTGLSVSVRRIDFESATISGLIRNSTSSPWVDYSVVNPVISPFYLTTTSSVLLEATNECSTRFFNKIRETQRAISGLTFLGELRETIRMLRRPASSLRDYTASWVKSTRKRTKNLKGRTLNKAISDSYLEYQYGVKPFLSDTADVARAVARLYDEIRTQRVVAGSRKVDAIATPWNGGVYVFSNIDGNATAEHDVVVTARAGLRAQADSSCRPSVTRLLEVTGFNFSEFIPTVWNLLPYSFLVDYFANVNDILTAYTTDTSSMTWYSRGTIYKRIMRMRLVCRQKVDALHSIAAQSAGGWTSSDITVSRTGTLQFPQLTFSLPNSRQSLNVAALMNSLRQR